MCTEASPAPPPDAPALLEDDEATGGFSFFKLSLSAVVSVIRVGGRRSIAVWVGEWGREQNERTMSGRRAA